MNGDLLVPNQDVPERIVQHDIIAVEDRSSRVTENGVHPLSLETFHEDLGTGESHPIPPSPGTRIARAGLAGWIPARPSNW